MRRRAGVLVAFTLLLGACGRLGVGIPGCPTAVTQPGTALVLSLQAVPSAEYAPCVNEVKFGWSGPRFDAERGLAETRFFNRDSNFLTARLTESCEIGPATPVESDLPGVERFEDIASVPSHLGVVIVPAGEDQLGYARRIVSEHEDTVVRDRVLRFRINQAFESSMRERAASAFAENDFVWIVGELDAEEGTLELRRTVEGEGARGLDVAAALNRMEGLAEEIRYRGNWYFRFEGGCITYDFDARGALAATVAEDAEAALGLYPLAPLRAFGEEQGYELE